MHTHITLTCESKGTHSTPGNQILYVPVATLNFAQTPTHIHAHTRTHTRSRTNTHVRTGRFWRPDLTYTHVHTRTSTYTHARTGRFWRPDHLHLRCDSWLGHSGLLIPSIPWSSADHNHRCVVHLSFLWPRLFYFKTFVFLCAGHNHRCAVRLSFVVIVRTCAFLF
jgi:hypothetical protein